MKKIVIISFYHSSNLGDIELSSSIEELIKTPNSKLIRYNFSTGEKVSKKENLYSPIKKQPKLKKKGIINLISRLTKKVIGESNFTNFYWKFKTSKVWNNKENLIKDIQNSDYVVFAGGNMIMDISPIWIYYLNYYTQKIKKFNKPYYFLFVGAGPIIHSRSEELLQKVFSQVSGVSVRDENSGLILDKFLKDQIAIRTVDPVFKDALEDSIIALKKSNILRVGVCVLGKMCFRSELEHNNYLIGLKELILELKKTLKFEFYLFSTEAMDYEAVKHLQDTLKNQPGINIKWIENLEELHCFYNKIDYLIGGRMHSMIIAQNLLLPYIGVIWQEKIVEFSKLTNRRQAMFSIYYLNSNREHIRNLIINDLKNKERILMEMKQTNLKLKKLVQLGKLI